MVKWNLKSTPCKFFALGACTKGASCTFSHGKPMEAQWGSKAAVGGTFPQGGATIGPKSVTCKFFMIGACTKGLNCPFSHGDTRSSNASLFDESSGFGAPNPVKREAEMCKFFLQGTCTKGVECRFSHAVSRAWGSGSASCYSSGKGGGGYGKAAGKSKGKGKGKTASGKTPGHMLPRTRISQAPFLGTITEWKGKYGWIKPIEDIEHEHAWKHDGNIFCGMDDIVDATSLPPGTEVQFHIWEDVSGLGAEEVMVQDIGSLALSTVNSSD